MILHLHNPVNQAHIEDLRDRLTSHLAAAPVDRFNLMEAEAVIRAHVDVVRAFDRGLISADDAERVLTQLRIPGFSLLGWLNDMLDEGVYVETLLDQAA
jgi:hypothetical protein